MFFHFFVNFMLTIIQKPEFVSGLLRQKRLFALFMEVFFINSAFSYAILPLTLITDEKYRTLSSDEKILYALLLNRINYSKKNST